MTTTPAHLTIAASDRSRHHRSTHPLWVSINDEWEFLATSTTAHRELQRWQRLHPELGDLATLADLKAVIDANPGPVLATLCGLYQDGSELAAKALLFAMVGKLVRLSGHARIRHFGRSHDPHERAAVTVTAFLSVAKKQDTTVPNIAASLSLKTLGAIQAEHTWRNEFSIHDDELADLAESTRTRISNYFPGEPSTHSQLHQLLQSAADARKITTSDHDLLVRAYLTEHTGQAAIAAELGISPATLRKRLCRAVDKARTALNPPALAAAS